MCFPRGKDVVVSACTTIREGTGPIYKARRQTTLRGIRSTRRQIAMQNVLRKRAAEDKNRLSKI